MLFHSNDGDKVGLADGLADGARVVGAMGLAGLGLADGPAVGLNVELLGLTLGLALGALVG